MIKSDKMNVFIARFDGGLNTKMSPLDDDYSMYESPDLANVHFTDMGSVETVPGQSNYLSVPLASAVIDGLTSYKKNDGTSYFVAACNGTLWRMSGNTGVTIPSGQATFATGAQMNFLTYQNQLFMSDGTNNPRKWNGTELTRWGAPTTGPIGSAAVNSAGTLTGSYTWVVLGVNSNAVQGDYSSACTQITLAAQRAYLTSIPVFPTSAGINTKYICRDLAANAGVYYLVTQIANATTVYEDNNSDSQLIELAPLDNGLPQSFTVMINHLGRIFGADFNGTNPSYLYFSNVDEPEIFSVIDFVRIGDGDGMRITGLAKLPNGIIVTKHDGNKSGAAYYLYTPDAVSANWTVTKLSTTEGAEASRTVLNFNNYICFLNRNGVFDLSETAIGSLMTDALSFKIEPDMFNLATGYINKSCGIVYKNKIWISVPYGSTATYNNRVYQYDFIRGRNTTARELGAWSRFTFMTVNDFAVHNDKLFGGSSVADGYIYELDTGYNNCGAAISGYYKTAIIYGRKEHRNNMKVWRYALIETEASGDWYLNITFLDYYLSSGGNTKQVSLDPSGASIWGTAEWGIDCWASELSTKQETISLNGQVSKTIQFKFWVNAISQYFKINSIKVYYNLKGER